MSKFIEVGFTALRDPATGGFLPAVPLYIEATEEAQAAEAAMIKDIGRVFADKLRQYVDAGGLKNHSGHPDEVQKGRNIRSVMHWVFLGKHG